VNWYEKVVRKEKLKIDQNNYAEDMSKLKSLLLRVMERKLLTVGQILGFEESKDLKSLMADPKLFLKDINALVESKPRDNLKKAKEELEKYNYISNNFKDFWEKKPDSKNLDYLFLTGNLFESVVHRIEIEEGVWLIGYEFLTMKNDIINAKITPFNRGDEFSYVIYYKIHHITTQNGLLNGDYYLIPLGKFVPSGAYFDGIRILPGTMQDEKQNNVALKQLKSGEVYKQIFRMKIPKYSLPGKYEIVLKREKNSTSPLELIKNEHNKQYIEIKMSQEETIGELSGTPLSMPASEFLLNPAVSSGTEVAFPWTGNIVGHIANSHLPFRKIIIRARGDQAGGVYPLLKVFINEHEVGQTFIKKEWQD